MIQGLARIDGESEAPKTALELDVLIRGVFEPSRFLALLRHFIVFEEDTDSDALNKIAAGYHQFHAVNAAVAETVRASGMQLRESGLTQTRTHSGKAGDRRVGVVWHTQGSGKNFSMLFYAARIVRHPAMQNPTLVVITDGNDLDDQLFGQFQRCHELLGQMPVQAEDRDQLRTLLQVSSGGVVFTTIQKFLPAKGEGMPELSPRQNIVVIADEAHRSQYDLINGLARNLRDALPNASFIGFTGTPIEKTDANTRAIFGDYILIYDIQRAVNDHGHGACLLRKRHLETRAQPGSPVEPPSNPATWRAFRKFGQVGTCFSLYGRAQLDELLVNTLANL